MQISELAQRSTLSVDTLRFYEKKGLIDSELINREKNNYRNYSDACLERVRLIQHAKRLGFTLAEIKEWIRGFENDQLTLQEKRNILGKKLSQIDTKIEDLIQMRHYLKAKIDALGK